MAGSVAFKAHLRDCSVLSRDDDLEPKSRDSLSEVWQKLSLFLLLVLAVRKVCDKVQIAILYQLTSDRYKTHLKMIQSLRYANQGLTNDEKIATPWHNGSE